MNDEKEPKLDVLAPFGTPGETRTHYLTLRRRTLCPGELRGLMQILFNFPAQQETNQLPLRRRTLYPAELSGQIRCYFTQSHLICQCVV